MWALGMPLGNVIIWCKSTIGLVWLCIELHKKDNYGQKKSGRLYCRIEVTWYERQSFKNGFDKTQGIASKSFHHQ
jgi:hypothetical protein